MFLPPCHVQSLCCREQNGSFPQPQNGPVVPQRLRSNLNFEGQILGLFARSLALQPSRDLGWFLGVLFENKKQGHLRCCVAFFFLGGVYKEEHMK